MWKEISYFRYLFRLAGFLGKRRLNHLHEQALPGKKALIIISNGKSTRANGYLDRTEKELHQAGVETSVFDKIQANPIHTTVMEGAKADP